MTPTVPIEIAACRSPRRFLDLQRGLYRHDPHYVPPLTCIDRASVDRRRNPFFQHAEVELFVARRGGTPVGRISATRDRLHDEFHGDRVGFFGHFEAADEAAAHALLAHARAWLRARGATTMRGPVDLSTNYRCGLLVEGEPGPPFVMMPHNPATYADWLVSFGLAKARDLLALHMHEDTLDVRRLERMVDRVRDRAGVVERRIRPDRLADEIGVLWELYNRIWERNWGFVPMTEAEFRHEAGTLKPVLRPELTVVLERDGDAVGFLIGVPDTNLAVRACNGRLLPLGWLSFARTLRRVRRFRVITLGILPEHRGSGLDAVLMYAAIRGGLDSHFNECEASWVLEDNVAMLRPLVAAGARAYRRYRIYEQALAAG
jgi:GNAT superfamily N-acetyltransferase